MTAITLDPPEVATNRAALDLNDGALRVTDTGPDWGDAEITQYLAELRLGQVPVDFRIPNRQITIPLILGANGKAGYAEARDALQSKVARIQAEGGWLSRVDDGVRRYCDIVNATLKLPDRLSYIGLEVDVILSLEAIPDFYGDEIAEITDNFSTNTIGNYTFDHGSGTLAVSGGRLTPSTTTIKQLFYSASPFTPSDAEITLKYTVGDTIGGATQVGIIARRLDASNFLLLRIGGSANTLVFAKSDGGSQTTIETLAMPGTIAADTSYWMRLRLEGNKITIEHWTSPPTPTGAAAASETFTLTGATATKFGEGIEGHVGLRMTPPSTDWTYDDLTITPYVYKAAAGDAELITAPIHGVAGHHPARTRIKVTNHSSKDILGLLFGMRSRNYSSEASAATAFEAEALTPLDTATVVADDLAASGQVVRHTDDRTDWTNLLSTDLEAGEAMTHVGTHRVWASVKSTGTDAPYLRLVYGVADLANPTENDAVQLPVAGDVNYYLVNLGEVQLGRAPIGSHQWQGRIQAKRADGGEQISIDKVWVISADDAYGAIRAPQVLRVAAGRSAADSFTGTVLGDPLDGRAAPLGGTWDTSGGDADDFFFSDSFDECISRNGANDTGPRYAILGSTDFAGVQVTAQAVNSHTPSTPLVDGAHIGLIARWTDASNHLRAYVKTTRTTSSSAYRRDTLHIEKVKGGTVSAIGAPLLVAASAVLASPNTIELFVAESGLVIARVLNANGVVLGQVQGSSSDLATGGTLETGRPGIYDYNPSTSTPRRYDQFAVSAAEPGDAVIYSGRSVELRTDGNYRENEDGTGWSRVPYGDLPRIPPAGREDRATEIVLKPSLGDLATIPDSAFPQISARIIYRPCWLTLT